MLRDYTGQTSTSPKSVSPSNTVSCAKDFARTLAQDTQQFSTRLVRRRRSRRFAMPAEISVRSGWF